MKNPNHTETIFEFPTEEMRKEYSRLGAEDFWLAGFIIDSDVIGFILSNGDRTKGATILQDKDQMIPETCKKSRKVEVYSFKNKCVLGFRFFDESQSPIFEVGHC